ncbi:MAG: hypothetical protein L0154_30105 [Chloroflexi bacterium]|nr:hypothetical protein [Chloroflexota bacterium]
MLNFSVPDDCFKVTVSTADADSMLRVLFHLPGGIVDSLETRVNLEPAAIRAQANQLLEEAGFIETDYSVNQGQYACTFERMP